MGTYKQYVADTKYNLSLPNFVPYFRTLSQIVPEKSLTEKVNGQIYKHCDRKDKNNIPPIYFICRGYNDAAAANVASVAVVNSAVVTVSNVNKSQCCCSCICQ